MGIIGVGTGAIACCLILWVSLTYNLMVSRHNKMDMVWEEMEHNLKLRRSLLGPFVAAGGQKIAAHAERIKDLLVRMPEGLSGFAITPFEREITIELERIRSIAEMDPDLMLDPDLVAAMGEIASTEGRAKAACERYNGLAKDFSAASRRWPANLIVNIAKMDAKEADIFA